MKQRVCNLLNEVREINNYEVVGICVHCKRANPLGKCRRCEKMVNKMTCSEAYQYQNKQERFKSWLYKVNKLLQSIQECELVCRHKTLETTPPLDELEQLLREVKSPQFMRQPDISPFPEVASGQSTDLHSMIQSKEMLEKLLDKIKPEASKESFDSSPSHKIQNSRPSSLIPRHTKAISTAVKYTSEKKTHEEKSAEEVLMFEKVTKPKVSPSDKKAIRILIKEAEKEKQKMLKEKKNMLKNDKNNNIELDPLPQLKIHVNSPSAEDSLESFVKCDNRVISRNEMIKGTAVISLGKFYTKDKAAVDSIVSLPKPLELDVIQIKKENVPPPGIIANRRSLSFSKKRVTAAGVFTYALSNREFIDKGWTVLPTTKIMRRINIYKMQPASLQFNWFERHKNKAIFYSSGKNLAETSDDGHGKWFYKNGTIALDNYNTEGLNEGQRTIVYSSSDDVANGYKGPRTVLASFDFFGNGVVYDKYGNERLKYNQSEGILYDGKIGPPSRWQWHSLNDPPVLRPVFMDTHVKHNDPGIEKLSIKNQNESTTRDPQPDMQKIEFDNFVKEKANKLRQKYKPFHIRMKTLKINDQFSLRVLDQANIYLLFREGKVCFKHNLGMILRNTDIIDTVMSEIGNVTTPYDKLQSASQRRNINRDWNIAKVQTKHCVNYQLP